MKVAGKLLVMLGVVAVVPLAVATGTSLATYERELDQRLEELHRRTSEDGARIAAGTVEMTRRTVHGLARAIPWHALSSDERRGALVLVFEQLEDIGAVVLHDARGARLAEPVLASAGSSHPAIAPAQLAALTGLPARPEDAVVVGSAVVDASASPIVPITFKLDGADAATWRLTIALSMRGICDELAVIAPAGVSVRLLGPNRASLCGPAEVSGDVVRASASAGDGWTVVAEQPRAHAYHAIERIRWFTGFWIVVGLLAAGVVGIVLTQTIRRPLRDLAAGADAVARGKLGHRVDETGDDEFAALARSFNHMSAEIQEATAELERRVEARTRELKAAQEELLQSRKLGAVAALGAGIAHEINNPLSGVLGMAQILVARSDQLDDKTARRIAAIEREALRIRDIVERVSTLAQDATGDARPIKLGAVVEAVARAHAARAAEAKVDLVVSVDPDEANVLGNPAQLEHALSQLVDNSLKAMPRGGRLELRVRSVEGELVAIDVIDTGKGIAREILDRVFEPFFTTKDDWRGVGLGLTVAHRIVEAHRGRVRVSSEVGTGTTMTILIPVAPSGAHLA